MRATIPRSHKKAIVEIFINSEENVCAAFKFGKVSIENGRGRTLIKLLVNF